MSTRQDARARQSLDAMQTAARVASVMVDGEEAKTIIMDRSFYHMVNANPRFRFMAGDYFDVDAASFLRMKKTLQRLALLLDFPVGTSLWVPVKGQEDHVTVAVHNGNMHRYWTFGQLKRKADGALAECLSSGQVVSVPPTADDPWVTVLAPVRDSLGNVSGVIEFTAMNAACKNLAPAWN